MKYIPYNTIVISLRGTSMNNFDDFDDPVERTEYIRESFDDNERRSIERKYKDSCKSGDLDTVKKLTGLCLPATQSEGLRLACYHGKLEVVKFLATSRLLNNNTLGYACLSNNDEVIDYIMENLKSSDESYMHYMYNKALILFIENSKLFQQSRAIEIALKLMQKCDTSYQAIPAAIHVKNYQLAKILIETNETKITWIYFDPKLKESDVAELLNIGTDSKYLVQFVDDLYDRREEKRKYVRKILTENNTSLDVSSIVESYIPFE